MMRENIRCIHAVVMGLASITLAFCTHSMASPKEPTIELKIAVASNFYKPLTVISQQFSEQTGITVRLIQGSSGKLYTQIKQGAPFDLLLSADQERPRRLEMEDEIIPGTRYTYAYGRLVLVGRFIKQQNTDCLNALLENKYHRLAFANPKLAPYGLATQQSLSQLAAKNTGSSMQPTAPDSVGNYVMGNNVAQTLNFLITGNAQLAFIAYSQLNNTIKREVTCQWLVPDHYYQPIAQQMVILKRTKQHQASLKLWQSIQSASSKHLIKESGYWVQIPDHAKQIDD